MSTLEAVMICLDNSEWMRNGDYNPTRLGAQTDTINYLTDAKLRANQESEVGILSMAGQRIEVHVAPCRSAGKITKALQTEVKLGGNADFAGALKTAQLALKNRQNKNLKQRIIVFVGSPIEEDQKDLVKLGKLFKKNNIAVDVINFGEENGSNENTEKLQAFVNAVKNGDNSHFLTIPPGPHELSDLIMTSGIMQGGGNVGGLGMGAGRGAAGLGGPADLGAGGQGSDDPETAMTQLAIRLSMEEDYQRMQKQAREREGKGTGPTTSTTTTATPSTGTGTSTSSTSAPSPSTSTPVSAPQTKAVPGAPVKDAQGDAVMKDEEDEDEEDEELAAALSLSLSKSASQPSSIAVPTPTPSTTTPTTKAATSTASTTQATSTQTTSTSVPTSTATTSSTDPFGKDAKKEPTTEDEDITLALQDPDFLNTLLQSVPGVDKDSVSSLLAGSTSESTDSSSSSSTSGAKKGKKTKKKKRKG